MDVHNLTDAELLALAAEPSPPLVQALVTEVLYWRGHAAAMQTIINEDTYHRGGGPYHCFCAALIGWEENDERG